MSVPVEWGDFPTWMQAAAGFGQVGHAIWMHRIAGAKAFAERLRDELGLDDGELADQIVTHAELGSLLVEGLEEAMRTQDSEKRWLLAKVVAAAFEGDDARFDEAAIFLRTARALEPSDMRALVEVARTRPDSLPNTAMMGAIRESDLANKLATDQRHFIKPMLATLVREGLVLDEALNTWDYTEPAWAVTPYGFRFLRFLPGRPPEELRRSTLVAAYFEPRVSVKNLGPGPAALERLGVSCDNEELLPERPLTTHIAAGERFQMQVERTVPIPKNGGARIVAQWTDGAGQRQTLDRTQWKRDMPNEVVTTD